MKKLFALILTLVLTLTIFGCSTGTQNEDTGKLKIVATIFPQYDFARTIAGNKAEVQMLITPGTESHSFEPTTGDIISINDCDIFIYTGGESDTWIDALLESADNPDMTVISLMDCVDIHDTHHHDHSHTDEHVWTSPVNVITISEKICQKMQEKDPSNAEYYEENLASYTESLTALDAEFHNIVQSAEHSTFIFADRFPLTHFAEEYGLNFYAAFSGCSEDTEPSAHTVAELIDKVNENNISTILKIELSSDSIANTIAKETGAKVLTFYSCHNISKQDFDNGESYLSLMQKNTETLKTALN